MLEPIPSLMLILKPTRLPEPTPTRSQDTQSKHRKVHHFNEHKYHRASVDALYQSYFTHVGKPEFINFLR